MRKGLFIFEKRLYKDRNGSFYDTVFTNEVVSRYSEIVDELTIIARVNTLEMDRESILKKYSEMTLQNVRIIEIPNVLSPSGMSHYGVTKRKILRYVDESSIIFVRVPTIWQATIVKEARKNEIPYVLEVGADAWATYWNSGGVKGKILAPYIEKTTKDVIKDSKYTVYVTNDWLQKRYPTKGKSIPCSNVDISMKPLAVLEERKERIRSNTGVLKIGTLADIASVAKGQQYIIQALGSLKKKGITNFEYHLGGNGSQERLRKVAEENDVLDQVVFDGLIRHDKIGDWFAEIDIYVQPSRQEGLPRSLIEAQSFAVPAFGARTGGIPELLEEKYIFSNTEKNIEEICAILLGFDKASLQAQAERNYYLSEEYDRDTIEARRRKFFLEAINSGEEDKK